MSDFAVEPALFWKFNNSSVYSHESHRNLLLSFPCKCDDPPLFAFSMIKQNHKSVLPSTHEEKLKIKFSSDARYRDCQEAGDNITKECNMK